MRKKILAFLKTFGIGIVTGLLIVFSLFQKQKKTKKLDVVSPKDEEDKFEKKANKKKQDTIQKITDMPAAVISDNYDDVCDIIAEGKQRFTNRAKTVLQPGRSQSDDNSID